MARSSYFQRIAHTDTSVPTLRPRPALFRRWELAQNPVTPNAFSVETETVKEWRIGEASRLAAPAPEPSTPSRPPTKKKISSEPQTRSPDTQLQRQSISPSNVKPPTAKVRGAQAPSKETGRPANPSISEASPRPTATETPKPITKEVKRKVASNTRQRVSVDLENASVAESQVDSQPARRTLDLPHHEKTNPALVEDKVATMVPTRTATKSIKTRSASPPNSESREEPNSSRRFRPSDKQQLPPTVKIGTIDIQVTPPPVPAPPVNPRRSSERKAAPALSRGFTSMFGLRQG